MAHGSIASLCTGHISVVPSLAAAVHAVGLYGADRHLDSEHHSDLLRVAFARSWASVGASPLDYAVGIRMRGNSWRNFRFAQKIAQVAGFPMPNVSK